MKTFLYDRHLALNAKMVDFSGWQMPIQYKGIVHEHQTVREKVGIFDVSHMGLISIQGKDAESFLDYLATNQIANKADFTATYTVFCNERGTCVDDLIIYRKNAEDFFLIVNAGNRKKDLQHVLVHKDKFQAEVTTYYNGWMIFALQGPKAVPLLSEFFPELKELKPMRFVQLDFHGYPVTITSTGYTGSGGFEICGPEDALAILWDKLLAQGEKYGIEPCGLGARDTLRLEMGYALYGHELDETIYPTESVAAWAVKMNKTDFLGKKALEERLKQNSRLYEYAMELVEKGVPRQGYRVLKNGLEIGKVLSGTFSPSLNKGIGIIQSDRALQENDRVTVLIRDKEVPAIIVRLPFYKKKERKQDEVYTHP